MELWVRSQDKQLLQKVNNGIIYYEDNDKRNCIANIESKKGISILGAYQTKERTLEVLDEIQRLITDLQYMSYAVDSSSFYSYRPNVYEMPKE